MTKKLTNREALQALVDGKKIRSNIWGPRSFIRINNDSILDELGYSYDFDHKQDEYWWELYEEPVPESPIPQSWRSSIPEGWIDYKKEKPNLSRPIFFVTGAGLGFVECISRAIYTYNDNDQPIYYWKYI